MIGQSTAQLIVLETVIRSRFRNRTEPCGAAELLEVRNAAAVITSERPEHHKHAGEAAVPVEGLLHVWNLTPPVRNLSDNTRTVRSACMRDRNSKSRRLTST
jgi:hypothetical protein